MPDEFFERYRRLTHQELYRLLRTGSAGQVEAVAGTWASIADTLAGTAAALRRDLDRLLPDWTGPGSREFHYRMELVARYAQTLADESAALRSGLTAMSHALADAQRRAEQPDVPARHDETTAGFDGVLGSTLGRVLPADELARAHERMALLVAELAADYGVADHGNWPVNLPDAPLDLPAVLDPALELASPLTGAEPSLHERAETQGTVLAAAAPVPSPTGPAPEPGPASRVETLRGGALPAYAIGIGDPAGYAAARQLPGTAAPAAPAASAASSASGSASASASAAAGAAGAPVAPMGMAPLTGGVTAGVTGEVSWRSADHLDWAEDDGESPPGVLAD